MKTLKIIKIGGNIIDDEVALKSFLKGFADIEGPKILVHGGGKFTTCACDIATQPSGERGAVRGSEVGGRTRVHVRRMWMRGKAGNGRRARCAGAHLRP